MTERDVPERERLALALDVATTAEALELARELRAYFAVVKVGLELFVAEGPPAVKALVAEGFDVFLDLKLHDIPNTVARAAARAAATGARYVTAHAAGGGEMLAAAAAGFAASARRRDGGILAVTVLTSEAVATPETIRARAESAKGAGCAGIVSAAGDLEVVRAAAPGLVKVVPGVRLPGASRDDQSRVATPRAALELGADLLVIGRTVTAAEDRLGAAKAVVSEVARAALKSG